MSDPYPLVPTDGPIPVKARRPLASIPTEAQPPPGIPMSAAPQVIYINTIAPPPSAPIIQHMPPPPMAAPAEHHYTTHYHTYRTARSQSNSALGMGSLALGIIACVICWVPVAGLAAVPIGAIGAVIGLLGVLVSILFRRSSAALPLTGVFVCCLAGGISIASTKSLPYWRTQLEKAFPVLAQHSAPIFHPVIRPSGASDARSSAPTVFDPSPAPAPIKSPPTVKPALPSHATITPPQIDPTVSAAMDRLTSAERACEARIKQTAEYRDAINVADAARARVAALRQTSPGSSDLKEASQAMINADNEVSAVLSRAMGTDAEVNFARSDLAAAKDKSRGRP